MYIDFYRHEGGKDWFSVHLDNDSFGHEIIKTVIARASNNATEAVNMGQFAAAKEYIEIAKKFEDALKEAKGEKGE